MGAIRGSSTAIVLRSWLEALVLMDIDPRRLRVERLLKRNQTIERIVTMGQAMGIDLPAQNQSYARALSNAIVLDLGFRMFIKRLVRNDIETPTQPGTLSRFAGSLYEAYYEAYKSKGEERARKLKLIETLFQPDVIWSAIVGDVEKK